MPEVPKIVRDRLRVGSPAATAPKSVHPDPDVLTAFAEQALKAAEREGVLQHLARCGECRELVALGAPPRDSASPPVVPEERELKVSLAGNVRGESVGQPAWFAWPTLRWAALAAGIALAGGILLIHPGKPRTVSEAKQSPASPVTQPEETIVAKQKVPSPAAGALNAPDLQKKAAPAERVFSRDKESKLAVPPADKARARAQIEAHGTDKDLAAGTAAGVSVGAPSAHAPVPPLATSTETVEVTNESAAVTLEEAQSERPVTGRQMAAPMVISRAKAAKTESNVPSALQRSEGLDQQPTADTASRQPLAAANANSMGSNLRPNTDYSNSAQSVEHHAQWALRGNDLQRLLDSGLAWKPVLHSDRPLLCYATNGNEIWVGGKGGDLFHSANGGLTWNRVHPSAQEQTLSDDVTNIDIYNSSHIVLSTSNHQTWSTWDAGRSWEKK